jgi:hypothetical protein
MAKIYDVINANNSGKGSLRHAVKKAAEGKEPSKIIITSAVKEPLVLKEEIVIRSEITIFSAARNDVVIRAERGRHFRVESAYLAIEGNEKSRFILREGRDEANGGSIIVNNPNNNTILKYVVLVDNRAALEGGAIFTLGSVILANSIVKNNEAGLQGGGIWAAKGVIAEESFIDHNQVTLPETKAGGGGIFVDAGDVILDKSSVSHNRAVFIKAKIDNQSVKRRDESEKESDKSERDSEKESDKSEKDSDKRRDGRSKDDDSDSDSSSDESEDCSSEQPKKKAKKRSKDESSKKSKKRSKDESSEEKLEYLGGSGGGIVVSNGSVYVQNGSHVNKNRALNAGGIQVAIGNVNVLTGSTVNHNKSFNPSIASGGGGVVLSLGDVYVSQSEISHNHTKGMFSAGIVIFLGDVTVDNSQIVDNRNRGPGGAIAANFAGTITVTNSKLLKNRASSLGGAIINFSLLASSINVAQSELNDNLLTDDQTIGETIGAFFTTVVSSLDNAKIQADENKGPGAKVINERFPSLIVQFQEAVGELKELTPFEGFIGGGGVAGLLNCPIIIDRSNVLNNRAKGASLGGGIFAPGIASSYLTVSKSTIANNQAEIGGGIYSARILMVTKSGIKGNRAAKRGGGILNDGSATLLHAEVIDNRAKKGGGIYNKSNNLRLVSSVVEDNKVDNIHPK